MKTFITFLLLCTGLCAGLQAQDMLKSSVFIIERQAGQIKFNEKEKKITLQQLEDVKNEKLSERRVQLEILEVVEEKDGKRFIVNDPKTDQVGLIYCYDIQQDGLKMYLMQRAKSVEFAKSYEIPENFGIQTYSWAKAKKISNQKDPNDMPKADALEIMKIFKERLEAIVGKEIPQYRDYNEQMYLTHIYYELLAEQGYNIFVEEQSLTVGINQYFLDEDIKPLRDEISLLIEGKDSISEVVEEETIEHDNK